MLKLSWKLFEIEERQAKSKGFQTKMMFFRTSGSVKKEKFFFILHDVNYCQLFLFSQTCNYAPALNVNQIMMHGSVFAYFNNAYN